MGLRAIPNALVLTPRAAGGAAGVFTSEEIGSGIRPAPVTATEVSAAARLRAPQLGGNGPGSSWPQTRVQGTSESKGFARGDCGTRIAGKA
jgi:hypothetical protein